MFDVGGTPRPADYVAAFVYHLWVDDATTGLVNAFFNRGTTFIPVNKRDAFATKIKLYCEADVLRVLLTEKQTNPRYLDLNKEFEKLIFPFTRTAEGTTKLEAIKSAMINIDKLIFEENKELSWARSWFETIGHNETNPATLFLLVELMGSNTRSLRQLIREIGSPIDREGF
jgi:hypothetical protein